jgi:cellulose synthase/poly-beta-1,6-N-acetylglucosamine synthase-like glycosyltransferase
MFHSPWSTQPSLVPRADPGSDGLLPAPPAQPDPPLSQPPPADDKPARWWLPAVALAGGYFALLAWQMGQGAQAGLPDSPREWVLAGLLHLPYVLILALLGFGLVERLGYFWRGRRPPSAGQLPTQCPKVCVQLPMFNERAVAHRIIEAAAAMRWPKDRLVIQVLDDSTDAETRAMVQAVCHRMREERGVHCVWVHRPRRTGYKAGALEFGRLDTDAEFIAIFDADFLPPPDYLERAIPHFYDDQGAALPQLALVQAQWGHLNDDESPLTEAQALWVDDHHSLQLSWRSANIGWVNFTGTAGVWRASAIEAVGGWRSASLVEDCELSVRALLAGYRTRFVRQLAVPAELPQTLAAYRLQQKRWTQGWAQLQRLHLGSLLWRLRTPPARKAFLLYVACISWQWPLWLAWIAMLPFLMANGWWLGALGTGPALLAYLAPPLLFAMLAGVAATAETRHGQGSHRGHVARRCARLLPYLVINTGMVPHHVCAFIEGLFGPLHAEFERTPKTASVTAEPGAPENPGTTAPAAITDATARAAPPAGTPKPPPSVTGATLRRRAYLGTEAAFCIAQLGWIGFFIGEGMVLGTVGAAWVVGCILLLRAAPAWQGWVGARHTAATGTSS